MGVLRLAEVQDKTALAKSTLYKYAGEGTFTRSIFLGARAAGWIDSEVHEWLE